MPSILNIMCWSINGLQSWFILIRIRIITIHTHIPVNITGSKVKPVQFSRSLTSVADGVDGMKLVIFVTFIFLISTAPWHPKMQFVIHAIVVHWDVWVSASDLRLLKWHFGGQIVKKNRIVNMRCFHAHDHGRRWVLHLLDLMRDCSKSVLINPLLVALW